MSNKKTFTKLKFDDFYAVVKQINKKAKFHFEYEHYVMVCYQVLTAEEYQILSACFKCNPIKSIHARPDSLSIMNLMITDNLSETIIIANLDMFTRLQKYGFVPKDMKKSKY